MKNCIEKTKANNLKLSTNARMFQLLAYSSPATAFQVSSYCFLSCLLLCGVAEQNAIDKVPP